MTVPPREVYDPDSNDPDLAPLIVTVRCSRCAQRYGETGARQFGHLAYAAGNKAHGVRDERGERLQGWVWYALTDNREPNAVAGFAKGYRRLTRLDRADAKGVSLRCPVCRAAPRVSMVKLQQMATEAATRRHGSIFV